MSLNSYRVWLFLIIAGNGFFDCDNDTPTEEGADPLLATVQNKSLSLSELDGMFPQSATADDSIKIIKAYVERWIRKSLLMQEAERNIPKDLNIDELVRDYRASLVQYSYEQQLVEQELDSTITKRELNEFYEKNKEQYQLDAPIIRCHFIKVPQDAKDLADIRATWQANQASDQEKLLALCNKNATEYLLTDSIWYKVETLAKEMPEGTIDNNNIGRRKAFTIQDNDFIYFFRLLELVNRKQIAPLSYIEGQASKVILHRRKIKLLEEKKEDLYEQKANEVKVFPIGSRQ
ncbi:MAG: hypothetical protein AAGJ18_07280 [Bacteroidota bacterium]